MSHSPDKPLIVDSAIHLIEQLGRHGVNARLFGSCAIWIACDRAHDFLRRSKRVPKDIDLVVASAHLGKMVEVLEGESWRSDRALQVWSENTRLRFRNALTGVNLDLCVNELRFAQTLDVASQLDSFGCCLTPTDLLLMKLQIMRKTATDVVDILSILIAFDIGLNSEDDLCQGRIAELTSKTWRWEKALDFCLADFENWLTQSNTKCASSVELAQAQKKMVRLLTVSGRQRRSASWYLEAFVGLFSRSWFNTVEIA